MPPLLTLLTIEAAEDVSTDVLPPITDLAAASASSLDNHREMNAVLLRYMRDEHAHTRLATTVAAGGRLLDESEDRWRLADPEGNEMVIVSEA